jgi:hypothetical protein
VLPPPLLLPRADAHRESLVSLPIVNARWKEKIEKKVNKQFSMFYIYVSLTRKVINEN